MRRAIERTYYSELVRYVELVLRDNGVKCRSIKFASTAPWPVLPKRFAIEIVFDDGRKTFCGWEDPEGFVDLHDSIDVFVKDLASKV